MRLSVRENDAGYSPRAFGAVVTVDGVEVKHCFTADEELGEARCYADPLRLNSTGDGAQEVMMCGDVVISFPGVI